MLRSIAEARQMRSELDSAPAYLTNYGYMLSECKPEGWFEETEPIYRGLLEQSPNPVVIWNLCNLLAGRIQDKRGEPAYDIRAYDQECLSLLPRVEAEKGRQLEYWKRLAWHHFRQGGATPALDSLWSGLEPVARDQKFALLALILDYAREPVLTLEQRRAIVERAALALAQVEWPEEAAAWEEPIVHLIDQGEPALGSTLLGALDDAGRAQQVPAAVHVLRAWSESEVEPSLRRESILRARDAVIAERLLNVDLVDLLSLLLTKHLEPIDWASFRSYCESLPADGLKTETLERLRQEG